MVETERHVVFKLPHRRRRRWVPLAMVMGLLVVVPLVLSVAIVLPPVLLALPPMALWFGVWLVFRHLDAPGSGASVRPAERARKVIPIHSARARVGRRR